MNIKQNEIEELRKEFDARFPELFRSEGGFAYTTCEEEVWDFIERNFVPRTAGVRCGDILNCNLCGKPFNVEKKPCRRYCDDCRFQYAKRERNNKIKKQEGK